MLKDSTYIGKVVSVNGADAEIEIDKCITTFSPIIKGKVYHVGQIGSFIKIPMGHIQIYGTIASFSNVLTEDETQNKCMLKIQLSGEIIGNDPFQRGISTYPIINSCAYIVTESDLEKVYGVDSTKCFEIGTHSASERLKIFADVDKFVLRHSAILGSTGSGKSNATAHIIDRLISDYPKARILLIDIHGEYSKTFNKYSKTFSIGGKNPLIIPFWLLNYEELSQLLVNKRVGEDRPEDRRFRNDILEYRKKVARENLPNIDENLITCDSPIPFDIKEIWYKYHQEVYGTYKEPSPDKQTEKTICIEKKGNPKALVPDEFEPYSMGQAAPYKSKNQMMYSYVNNMFLKLKDPRFNFMFEPSQYNTELERDIDDLLVDWIDNGKNLTILDLSGVPSDLIDVSVGLISRIVFDSMFWGRNMKFTGRNRPILLAYEEAHTYLTNSKGDFKYANKAVEKIFKEGRKFGVGAMIVTQRPTEISETILSQVGTFVALRLTNSEDKNRVKSLASNNMTTMMEMLPTLRTGEGIVIGEAMQIPTRVLFRKVEPRPNSNDPEVSEKWSEKISVNKDYKVVVKNWREQKRS
ncbi:protein of unknown function DUF87 [Clostridium sp. DL-VIII]|uniref:ATP-binding protein n=1 Tax=Clostridium sp. DL-VIII TaxID=641107 RepID=UPI00023AF653|nr:ATP-binding protein [Clostridium sp. DL-VIII]EHI96772.1 protein of unknown function DUF87 [Clostridium sp. DL-VIII]